jgi:RNA polymerase sigma-70 factor (ECF subfamily)
MPGTGMTTDERGLVTQLLQQAAGGQAESLEQLLPMVYGELRKLAAARLRGERAGHTLQPTALVHEAYMRLVEQRTPWQNRAHFFAIAAQAMRRIVIDHARSARAAKRGSDAARVTLEDGMSMTDGPQIDVIALEEALERLQRIDARAVQIVELRFFAGLDVVETGEAVGVSPATVKREWASAKAWLRRELATTA